ncbi:MAG: 50S ribosomal protein L33 [Sandaracinus sp.]|jgi:large subunit ribosomal protein L33|nr:50S ribosomal protein L33 [Sandaracinus sp.]
MRRGGTRVKVRLECSVCGSSNYETTKQKASQERLILKKFCPTCRTHTEHRESR